MYDPLEGRDPNTFKKQVDVLRPFLAAYIDEFEHVSEDESIDSQDRLADSVEDWRIHNGLCTRVSQEELARWGSGIFIARYMDLSTRLLVP